MKLLEKLKKIKIGPIKAADYLNKDVLRNVIYLTIAIAIFFFGVIIYGVILNLRNVPLSEALLKTGFSEKVQQQEDAAVNSTITVY